MDNPQFIDVAGTRTRYFEAGNGPALLLVHGGDYDYRLFPSSKDWSLNFHQLSKRFRVIAVDKLGSGGTDSPKTDDGYTQRAVIDHVFNFIEALNLNNLWLWGHSRGGLVVLRLAVEHPNLISGLTITNSQTAAPEDPSIPRDIFTRRWTHKNQLGSAETMRNLLGHMSFDIENPNVQLLYQNKVSEVESQHPDRPMTTEGIEHMHRVREKYFLPEMLDMKYETLEMVRKGGLVVPTQVIWGFNDPQAPVKVGLDFYQRLAMYSIKTEFHVINRSGHKPHGEYPRDVESLVFEFTSRHGHDTNETA